MSPNKAINLNEEFHSKSVYRGETISRKSEWKKALFRENVLHQPHDVGRPLEAPVFLGRHNESLKDSGSSREAKKKVSFTNNETHPKAPVVRQLPSF